MSYCPMCAMSPNEVFALREEAAALRTRIAELEAVVRKILPTWEIAVSCDECGGNGELMEMVCYGDKPLERWTTCPQCVGSGVEYWKFSEFLESHEVTL